MKCPRCERENREGRRFCAKCGASLAFACPSCGFSNEPGENFCGGCGARLGAPAVPAAPRFSSPEAYTPKHLAEKILTSKAALEGERKQVTVLFADLKGSRELLADRDSPSILDECSRPGGRGATFSVDGCSRRSAEVPGNQSSFPSCFRTDCNRTLLLWTRGIAAMLAGAFRS
jgi:hypothetical protein